MNDLNEQQQAFIKSKNPVQALVGQAATGKTLLLLQQYLQHQKNAGTSPKALFFCGHPQARWNILDLLERITNENWQSQWIGTPPEIASRMVMQYYPLLGYYKQPQWQYYADQTDLYKQWIVDATDPVQGLLGYTDTMRQSGNANIYTALVELCRVFTQKLIPEFTQMEWILADDVHLWADVWLFPLLAIREPQYLRLAYHPLYPGSRYQGHASTRQWLASLPTIQMDAAYNISQNTLRFLNQFNQFIPIANRPSELYLKEPFQHGLYEVRLPHTQDLKTACQKILQHARQTLNPHIRSMAVIYRNHMDAIKQSHNQQLPLFQPGPVQPELQVATVTDAPYLQADCILIPNCHQGYWPYAKDHPIYSRVQFAKLITSAKHAVFFWIPDKESSMLSSPFLSEGNTPKLAMEQVTL